jgi:hypothetical protein
VFEELDDVRRLNAGIVVGAGLAPIPGTRATRVELGVLDGAVAIDADPAPPEVSVIRGDLRS